MEFFPEEVGSFKFAAILSLYEVEMKLAIVIRHSSLNGMARACRHSYDPYKPFMIHEEITRHILTQTDCDIYAEKPYISRQSVEDSADTRILLGHSRQLTIGRVKTISPDEQNDPQDVDPDIIKVESDSGSYAENNGGDRDCVRGHTESGCDLSPNEADRAIEDKVKGLLSVH